MYHSYDKEGLLREERRSDTRERRKSNLAIPRHLVKRVRENPVKRTDLLLGRMFLLPPERVVTEGGKGFLRDAWWPQNLHGDAWLNPNYRRDARPDMTMRCVICYCTRYPWQVNALWPRRVPLFDLDRYQLFRVNRVLGVLTKINKPWQPWHCFLFFFRPLLTFAWPLVSLIFVVGPNNHNTKGII